MLTKEQPRTLSESEQKALRSAGIHTTSEEVEAIEQKHAKLDAMRYAERKRLEKLRDDLLRWGDFPEKLEDLETLKELDMQIHQTGATFGWIKRHSMHALIDGHVRLKPLGELATPNQIEMRKELLQKMFEEMGTKPTVRRPSYAEERELFILDILRRVANGLMPCYKQRIKND